MSPFQGSAQLIAALDAAVRHDCQSAITNEMRRSLCELIERDEVKLPACVFEPVSGHYARRELYCSDEFGYAVIAMTWGPGQGTLIHDHDGMWCVESVWHGEIEVTPYELLEQTEQGWRFAPRGTMSAGRGSAGSLIPPHDHHTIHNPSSDAIAVTLHVYRGSLNSCAVFLPQDNGWYQREERSLSLDQ